MLVDDALDYGGKAAKLGRVMTAGALIYGDVDEQYREIPTDPDRIKNKDGTITMLEKWPSGDRRPPQRGH